MRATIVLTLTGKDRIGLVEEITEILLRQGGNVETSRMARLGGEFTILMLATVSDDRLAALEQDLSALVSQGYKITTSRTDMASAPAGAQLYQIEVLGADHEGIIHEIAHSLSQRGINIEAMETGARRAPVSGSPLFSMTAQIAVPAALAGQPWEQALEEAGHRLNVEVKVSAVKAA